MKQIPSILIQIVHINGPLKGEIQEFGGAQVAIGRHPSCDVVFPKDQTLISRRHAVIRRDGNAFKLIDESANGTFVNGKGISEALLKSGDVITVGEGGPKISFLTQVGRTPTAPLPPDEPKHPFPEPGAPLESVRDATPSDTPSPWTAPPVNMDKKPAHTDSPWEPSRSEKISEPPPIIAEPQEIPVVATQQSFVIQYGPRLETFKTLPITLGRGTDCDLILDHDGLSEHHAQIFYYQDQYWIKDLSGRNIISLNGETVQSQAPLTPQAQLTLSPQGPHFNVLGEGRLAETSTSVSPSQANEPASRPETSEVSNGKRRKFSGFIQGLTHKD